jgi:exodeoxyribonuclease VII small subunit
MAKEAKPEPFELVYARLEQTVAKLEEGGLPLDDAIALYEEGMALARQCQEQLDKAELKITKLRESFAPIAARTNGAQIRDEIADYEYVADDGEPEPDDDPFA